MLKIDLLLLLIALTLAQFAPHRDRETSEMRIWPQIDEISLAHDAADRSAAAQLRIQAWTELDCAAPLQTEVRYFPDNIDVQVYRGIPAPAACKAERRPIAVDLSLRTGAEMSYIIINDQVWARDNEGLYHALSLAPIFVDSATLSRPDAPSGNRALRIRGSQAVGCDLPLLYAWRDTADGVLIGVYNAIDPGSACPAVLVEVDETLEFAATELTVSALLSVNAVAIDEMEMEQVSDIDKVLTNIMRVDAHVGASRPARISLVSRAASRRL